MPDQVRIDQVLDGARQEFDGYFRIQLPSKLRQRMESLGRNIPPLQHLDQLSLLGHGTYGRVYSMKVADQPVAVKIYHEPVQDAQGKITYNAATLERLEIGHVRDFFMSDICGRLRQCVPFVASALCLDQQVPAVVMPRYDTDLFTLLRHQGVTPAQRHSLMKDLLTAVADLHSHGYMHRDIKPGNCFLDENGRLFLGDFNLTRTSATDKAHTLTGFEEPLTPITQTLVYRAPEIALKTKRYTSAIDCWSVGLVWLELLKHDLVLTHVQQPEDTWGLLYVILRVLGPPGPTAIAALRQLGVPKWRLKELMRHAFHLSDNGYPMAYEFETILKRCCCLAEAQVLCGLLDWNPETRWTAAQALQSAYFTARAPSAAVGGACTTSSSGRGATTGTDPSSSGGPSPDGIVPGLHTPDFSPSVGAAAIVGGANPGETSRENRNPSHSRNPLLRPPPVGACCAAHAQSLNGPWNRSVKVDVVPFWPYRVPPLPLMKVVVPRARDEEAIVPVPVASVAVPPSLPVASGGGGVVAMEH